MSRLLAAAPPQRYRRSIELVASSGEADAMIVIHIPPLAGGGSAELLGDVAVRLAPLTDRDGAKSSP